MPLLTVSIAQKSWRRAQSPILFPICSCNRFCRLSLHSANMITQRVNIGVTNAKGWIFKGQSLLVESVGTSYQTETKSISRKSVYKRQDLDHTIPQKVETVETVETTTTESAVNLSRPTAPTVTYVDIVRFVIWSIMVVITQAWRDFVERRPFRPTLASDSVAHYYVSLSPSTL